MKAAASVNGTSLAAIFARVWETENGRLPPGLARHILKLGFAEEDRARMHQLAARNQEGTITPEELRELDSYIQVGDLLAILQSKAHKLLGPKPC